nr:otopetrin [Hymenolepis microstoma]
MTSIASESPKQRTTSEVDNGRRSVMSSLLFLFGVLEGVLSFALPIINAFGRPTYVEHQLYFEIFQIIQFTLSIFSLAYLQALLAFHSRQQNRLIEKMIHRLDEAFDEDTHPEPQDERNEDENAHSDEKGNVLEEVEVGDITLQETHNGMDSLSAEAISESPLENTYGNDSSESTETESIIQAVNVPPRRRKRSMSMGWMFGDNLKPEKRVSMPFAQHPIGSNLYLRLGAVVFGFGVMIMDGLRAADKLDENNHAYGCHSVLWIPVKFIHSCYVIFNVQKSFVRFIFCHLTVVNMGQWLSTVVQEIVTMREDHVFTSAKPTIMNSTNVTEHASDNIPAKTPQCRSQVSNFAHFLIPCGVEYSLIAMAIFYKMLQRIGSVHHAVKSSCGQGAVTSTDEAIQFLNRRKSLYPLLGDIKKLHWTKESHCQRAHKGLFFGLLLIMATIVALSLFYTYLQQHNHQEALLLYELTDITLLIIGVLTTALGLFQLRSLRKMCLLEGDTFDVNLLVIGLVGMLFYDMFLLVPAAEMIDHSTEVGLFVGKAVMEISQALFQVFLILETSRRRAADSHQVSKKPGRAVITFLLILNLAMWIVNVFELKHAENHPVHRRYYSPIVWKIITRLSLPLLIFFRFHSSICLADAWTNIYQIK